MADVWALETALLGGCYAVAAAAAAAASAARRPANVVPVVPHPLQPGTFPDGYPAAPGGAAPTAATRRHRRGKPRHGGAELHRDAVHGSFALIDDASSVATGDTGCCSTASSSMRSSDGFRSCLSEPTFFTGQPPSVGGRPILATPRGGGGSSLGGTPASSSCASPMSSSSPRRGQALASSASYATTPSSSSRQHHHQQPPQPAVPLPMCPDDHACQLVNAPEHQAVFRHTCRLSSCPSRRDPWHVRLFDHPAAAAASSSSAYSSPHSWTLSSASPADRPLHLSSAASSFRGVDDAAQASTPSAAATNGGSERNEGNGDQGENKNAALTSVRIGATASVHPGNQDPHHKPHRAGRGRGGGRGSTPATSAAMTTTPTGPLHSPSSVHSTGPTVHVFVPRDPSTPWSEEDSGDSSPSAIPPHLVDVRPGAARSRPLAVEWCVSPPPPPASAAAPPPLDSAMDEAGDQQQQQFWVTAIVHGEWGRVRVHTLRQYLAQVTGITAAAQELFARRPTIVSEVAAAAAAAAAAGSRGGRSPPTMGRGRARGTPSGSPAAAPASSPTDLTKAGVPDQLVKLDDDFLTVAAAIRPLRLAGPQHQHAALPPPLGTALPATAARGAPCEPEVVIRVVQRGC